jgi:hypothetical protein
VSTLDGEYRRIAASHRVATRHFTARSCIPPSVTRVFAAGTKDALLPVLARIPVDELPALGGEAEYRVNRLIVVASGDANASSIPIGVHTYPRLNVLLINDVNTQRAYTATCAELMSMRPGTLTPQDLVRVATVETSMSHLRGGSASGRSVTSRFSSSTWRSS